MNIPIGYSSSSSIVNDSGGYGPHKVYINGVRMPVAPKAINIKIDNKNKTLDMVNGDIYKVLNLPGLTSYSLEFIIPHDVESIPGAVYENGFLPPQYFFDMFEQLKVNKKKSERVFRFIVIEQQGYNTSQTQNIAQYCTLEDYQITQDMEKYGLDFLVSMTLESYQEHTTEKARIFDNGNGTFSAIVSDIDKMKNQDTAPIPEPHVVVPGDTLCKLAYKLYGDESKYKYLSLIHI